MGVGIGKRWAWRILLGMMSAGAASATGAVFPLAGDVYPDGRMNVYDVQGAVNTAFFPKEAGSTNDDALKSMRGDANANGVVDAADIDWIISSALGQGGVMQRVTGRFAWEHYPGSVRLSAVSTDGWRVEAPVDESGAFSIDLWCGRGWALVAEAVEVNQVLRVVHFTVGGSLSISLPLLLPASSDAMSLGDLPWGDGVVVAVDEDVLALYALGNPNGGHALEARDASGLPLYARRMMEQLEPALRGSLGWDDAALAAWRQSTAAAWLALPEISKRPSLLDVNRNSQPDFLEQTLSLMKAAVVQTLAFRESAASEGAVEVVRQEVDDDLPSADDDRDDDSEETEHETEHETEKQAVISSPELPVEISDALEACRALFPALLESFGDPLLIDSDGDACPDVLAPWRVDVRGLLPALADACGDADADGVINVLEDSWPKDNPVSGAWPWLKDADGDGVPDPADWDDDGDGLPDAWERAGTMPEGEHAPSAWDADLDGIPDALDRDANGDGMVDETAAPKTTFGRGELYLMPETAPDGEFLYRVYWNAPDSGQAAAIQFSVQLPGAATLETLDIRAGDTAEAAGKRLYLGSNGSVATAVIAGMNQTPLESGPVAVLRGATNAEANNGAPIQLLTALGASADGSPVRVIVVTPVRDAAEGNADKEVPEKPAAAEGAGTDTPIDVSTKAPGDETAVPDSGQPPPANTPVPPMSAVNLQPLALPVPDEFSVETADNKTAPPSGSATAPSAGRMHVDVSYRTAPSYSAGTGLPAPQTRSGRSLDTSETILGMRALLSAQDSAAQHKQSARAASRLDKIASLPSSSSVRHRENNRPLHRGPQTTARDENPSNVPSELMPALSAPSGTAATLPGMAAASASVTDELAGGLRVIQSAVKERPDGVMGVLGLLAGAFLFAVCYRWEPGKSARKPQRGVD